MQVCLEFHTNNLSGQRDSFHYRYLVYCLKKGFTLEMWTWFVLFYLNQHSLQPFVSLIHKVCFEKYHCTRY